MVVTKYNTVLISGIMSATAIMSGEKVETAPFDPRFPNQNQTKYVMFSITLCTDIIDTNIYSILPKSVL